MAITISGSGQNVLQVVANTVTDTTSAWYGSSSTNYQPSAVLASITPSRSDSKILVFANMPLYFGTNNYMEVHMQLQRSIGGGSFTYMPTSQTTGSPTLAPLVSANNYDTSTHPGVILYLDSPGTTSSVVYQIYVKIWSTVSPYVYPSSQSYYGNFQPYTIQLMEISQS
jgi:hypothetical protein